MTNEEKIRQIRVEKLRVFDGYGVWMDCVDIDTILLEMAEWKDKQFEDMKEKIKVDTKIEVGYEIREKISNGASILSLDTYARHLCTL